jgi:signal transduction histidine kinase
MLSLQAETCETQVERLMQASDPEDAEIFVPLKERLHKLVTVSKQALWETRNYMFSLKPLMSGATTLTRMLSTQISEFETISDLPTRLVVHGSEDLYDEPYRHSRRYAQIGTAIFRIVQEALTNAYKHAAATQLNVILTYTLEHIEVDISDDGKGLAVPERSEERPEGNDPHHIYSGRGMHGMKERAEELDGSLTVLPGPTRGTVVRICIPL